MPSREQISEDISKLEIMRKTQDKLKRAGLTIPPKPTECAEGVNIYSEWDNLKRRFGGVANIPFTELGDFLDRFSSLIAYARWTEAVADMDQQSAREIRDTINKQLYTIQDGSRELRSAMVTVDPLYVEWENNYIEKFALYTAVKGLREGYEGRANALSREITRRSATMGDTIRSSNRGVNA